MIMDNDNQWGMRKIGPLIFFRSPFWEVFVTLQIVYRQDGHSTAIITRWDIDSDASCERHMDLTWDQYWKLFLDMIPDECVAGVMSQESLMKY